MSAPFAPGDKVRPLAGRFKGWLSGSGPGTVVKASEHKGIWFIAVRWPDSGLITVTSDKLRPAKKRVTS